MDVSSLLILFVLLALAVRASGDLDSIQMTIKHGAKDENFIATFSLRRFERFYSCMCNIAYTQCSATLANPLKNEQQVRKVDSQIVNTRFDTHYTQARLFSCFHNATSEIIICSLINDDVNDEYKDEENITGYVTEWLHLLKENCSCVGIQWQHPRETVLSKNDRTSLRRSNCKRNLPMQKTLPTKSSSTVTSSRRKTAQRSKDNKAPENNLWIIVATVIVVLCVIILVLLFVVLRGRCNTKCCSTCKQEQAVTNKVMSDSVTCTILEQAVSNNDNNAAGVRQVKNLNLNGTEACQKSGITVQNKTNRLCDDTDLCYVEINHPEQSKQNNESKLCDGTEMSYVEINVIDHQSIQNENDNYDVIDDNEIDPKQNMKVEGLAALKCPAVTTIKQGDGSHGGSGEDDVYERYNEEACRDRFPEATAGLGSKNVIEGATLYSSVDENCEVKYSSIIFEENSSDINTSHVDIAYEETGVDNARNNNHNNYEDMSMDNSQNYEHSQNKHDICFYGDVKFQEDNKPIQRSNNPGIGDGAATAPVYSRLRNEICERTHPYDVLCESNAHHI